MKPQLMSGARAQVKVAGSVIAYVTDVSIDSPTSVRAVHTFGSVTARSVEPLMTGPVTVNLGSVVPVNKADGTAIDSSPIAEGIEPLIQNLLQADDITVELVDRVNGAVVASIRNCRYAGSSLSTSAGQLAQRRISLQGIYDAGQKGQNAPGSIGF